MRLAALVLAVLPIAVGRAAHADGPLHPLALWKRAEPGLWLSSGATVGTALRLDGAAALIAGGEVSLYGFAESWWWAGGYLDAAYVSNPPAARLSFGPEVGIAFFGLDAGAVLEWRDATVRPGLRVRVMISVAYLTLYGGYVQVFGDAGASRQSIELGLLVKLPMRLYPR